MFANIQNILIYPLLVHKTKTLIYAKNISASTIIMFTDFVVYLLIKGRQILYVCCSIYK